MHERAAALCLVLAACANAPGAADTRAPFAAAAPEANAGGYETGIDLPAGRYRLDRRHASVHFRIRHMDLAWFTARFDEIDATLLLDPADPAQSTLGARVGAASVNTGVLDTRGARGFDNEIAAALGAGATPQIGFASTAIERTGRFTARVTGDLTMNGRTRPATLHVTFDGAAIDPLRGGAQVLGFSGYGEIDRTHWGVTQWRSFTGDTVQIVIEAEFVRG